MSRLIKLREGLAVIIPEELCKKLGLQQGQEVAVKESKFGIFVNPTPSKAKPRAIPPTAFSQDETELINKLLSLKFAERTPTNVSRSLDFNENRVLSELIGKGAINLFKNPKYKEGVYNISDKVYALLKKEGTLEETTRGTGEKKETQEETDPIKRLEKQGYIVVENEGEARRLSDELAAKIKRKDITGIRGFDKKYYILKMSFFVKNQLRVKNSLKAGKKSVDQISSETGLDRQACIGILTVLNEEGDVIEKKRGIFALAE